MHDDCLTQEVKTYLSAAGGPTYRGVLDLRVGRIESGLQGFLVVGGRHWSCFPN